MNVFYKFRVFILTTLILFNLGFIFSLPFNGSYNINYWVLDSIINFLLAIFAVYLLHADNTNKTTIFKIECINNFSPYGYAFYDFNTSELNISNSVVNLFSINNKEKFDLRDLQPLFTQEEWVEINQIIVQQIGSSPKKTGVIELTELNTNINQYIEYIYEVISDKQLLLNGLIFWFKDISHSRIVENELVELIKKYRLISFENDMILNSLPFPIWRRNSLNEFTFKNDSFNQILIDINAFTEINLTNNLLQLANKSIQTNRLQKLIHNINIKNKLYTFEFHELPLGENVGSIGYAINIENFKEIGQKIKTYKEAFNTLLDISSRAHLMLNFKQEVISFNRNILELYNFDLQWLKSKPTFSHFIDALHEINKLPEVQDYKIYKEKLLKLARELTYQHSELMHLPNNITLSFYFIPLKDGSMIISIDDISESLNLERTLNEQIIVQSKILNYVDHPIIIIGQDARVKSFNEALVKNYNLDINFISSTPKVLLVLEKMLGNLEIIEKINEAISKAIEAREENDIIDNENKKIWAIKNLPDSSTIILINEA